MNQEEQGKKMGQIIAKAWADEEFKKRLLKEPRAVLKEEGIEVPEGLDLRVIENTTQVFHIVLPNLPVHTRELDMDQLAQVAGGAQSESCGCGNPMLIADAWRG